MKLMSASVNCQGVAENTPLPTPTKAYTLDFIIRKYNKAGIHKINGPPFWSTVHNVQYTFKKFTKTSMTVNFLNL